MKIIVLNSAPIRGNGIIDAFTGGNKQVASSPPTPPPAPTRDDAATIAAQDYANRTAARKAGGLDSTILTSAAGDTTQANIGKKTLLGS